MSMSEEKLEVTLYGGKGVSWGSVRKRKLPGGEGSTLEE